MLYDGFFSFAVVRQSYQGIQYRVNLQYAYNMSESSGMKTGVFL